MSGTGKGRAGWVVLAVGTFLSLWTAGCEGDSLYEGVAITPASVELRVGEARMFKATGGHDYEWTFEPVDGRLGLDTAVGDTVVATAFSNSTGEDAVPSVIALTCRSIIPGVTDVATNGAESVATAYIRIR